MEQELDVESDLQKLSELVEALKKCGNDRERIEALDRNQRVQRWMQSPSWLRTFSASLSPECELIIKSLIAIGQEEHLLISSGEPALLAEKLRELIEELFPVETFYKEIGGIIGYHWTMFSLLSQGEESEALDRGRYHRPPGIDISSEDEEVRQYILQGIVALPLLAEIYPVGGAADRLKFCDPGCGQPMPAAKLFFCGRTLLEGLIRDVQAREYLYYKLFGEQTTTPIAMMTSVEKDNHRHILDLCETQQWFGRPKDSFRLFCQPVVPTMDKNGKWCLSGPMKFLMKPGGHGVIWKVAKEEGVFDWMQKLGRKKVLVRQINNPIAGIDYGVLAFCGIGFRDDKAFGFASCPRQVKSAEGVNILFEKKSGDQSHYCLTNVEYCDFPKFRIRDVPENLGSSYSQFPSNTNILFADIAAVKETVKCCPIPGMLVNLKTMSFTDSEGNLQEKEVARLESTMQNLADCFEQAADSNVPIKDVGLRTYLTYNHRRKTISTTKKLLLPGASLLETPEGCYYDQLLNAYDLLSNYCHFSLPPMPSMDSYLHQGPSFLFSYHPAIGPLFSVIGQKLRGGTLNQHSEMKLEIAEADIENLTLFGSLHVIAEQVMGEKDEEGILHYSDQTGKCRLRNVTVRNRGVDWEALNSFWRDQIERAELCEIQLRGDGEFIAENVNLNGGMRIVVESGTRVTAIEAEGEIKFKTEALSGHETGWVYHLADDGAIQLEI
ncbi:MAG: UTP--glucose-1-phosphate uridylyltransferase [Verrucomicrobia bacterium]|nr:UTP--glucose-1-phosphate uridylyltransferase [Verrucomicrobiota bacterium]